MQNLHRHTSYSNIFIADSAASNEDYAKRAVELGHKTLSSVEHGWQGNYFQTYELAKKYNLKPIIGAEAYWVKDREAEYEIIDKKGNNTTAKDRSNHHIILLAKSNQGREAINDILSEANITGYYYRPRVDLQLLLSLPPKDVVITTACIAFNGYEDIDDIILQLHDHFDKNFLLEYQYHHTDKQIEWNKHLLELSKKYKIEPIVGLDSHYIYPEEATLRDYILDAKNVHYEDEEGWFMDYPDDDTLIKRFTEQGVLNKKYLQRAIDNTDIALDFCDYDNVRIFTKDIKLPSLYPNDTKEEKELRYKNLIAKQLKKYIKNIPTEEIDKYKKGVRSEVQTYIDTGMVDYPLLNYAIVKDAIEHGGLITDSGRGSAVGFFTNTLCGFSKVDRFTSAIKLYPERFISTTRILETKSLPDIDLNVGTPEIFEESQKRVLGNNHVAPMIAFGTLKKKSAFKLYARAKNMNFDLANEISEEIGKYDEAVKNAGDDADEIDIFDFIDKEYEDYIEQSKHYWGVISDKKKAPSAYLLYDGDIRHEIGLIKCKSEATKKEYITCVIDGMVAENYKFLKNDILKVDVVLLIDKVFKRIGIEHFDVNTLIKKVKDDKKVWELYSKGYTIGLNQVEQDGSRKKCMAYKPHNLSELSAFVAAIRPGFKSMYSKFENREDFSWGIPTLDNLLRTEELPVSFLFFQEQLMSVLNYGGFPMDECYGIIKAIAKKHPEKVRPLKQKFIDGFRERLITDEGLSEKEAQKNAEDVWVIISDNCGYGFNCVSGNTRMIRGGKNDKFNPTVEEMYKIKNDYEYAKKTNHLALRKKYRLQGYGQALSMFDDHKLHPNQIVDIVPAGIRQTYLVKTESGCELICTNNHKFPTPFGKKRLDELKIGDELYCKGEYYHKYFDTSLTDGIYESNVPQKGEIGFQNRPNGASVVYEEARRHHIENNDNCEMCGKQYQYEARFELHHKDFDRHNNQTSNYMWLCCSCHKKIHYENGRKKRYENGIDTYLSKIISIEPYDIEMTYDVEMSNPAHTFVSESGLVTSNSAHAYCMALDSLYQAWQKANYPYEFYEVLLQHYTDKGNKLKAAALKNEMKEAFEIKEGQYRFGLDNRKFTADPENHSILPSLSSVKSLSQRTADDLYSLRNNKYTDFTSLLIDLIKTTINSKQLDILVKIGYFEQFGKISELLENIRLFELLYDKKQLTIEKCEKNNIPLWIVDKHSQKKTEKMFKEFDDIALIKDILEHVNLQSPSVVTRVGYEFEYLGYSTITDSRFDKEHWYVVDVLGTYKNMLSLYNLKYGTYKTIKYKKDKYLDPPTKGHVIKVFEYTNRYKMKPDGVDSKGKTKFITTDEQEVVISKYSVVY